MVCESPVLVVALAVQEDSKLDSIEGQAKFSHRGSCTRMVQEFQSQPSAKVRALLLSFDRNSGKAAILAL